MAQNVVVPPFDEAPVTVVGPTPQSVFPFEFPFWEADDLIVYIDGVRLGSNGYTVEGYYIQNGDPVEGGFGSGAVTLNAAVSNCSVTIDRLVVAARETQFSRSAPLGMPTLNSDLNKLAARQQDLARSLLRAVIAPVGEDAPSPQDVIDAARAVAIKEDKNTLRSLRSFYGGAGDGATNDTAAVQAANAAGGVVYVPEGRFETTLGFYDLLNARFTGEGQVELGGYAQARDRSFMTAEIGDVSFDRTRIFDGDWSKAHDVRYAYRGGNVGKSPITAYRNLTLASPEIRVLDFTGGTNTDLANHAGGRTGMADQRFLAYHGGQGDLVERTYFGEVYSARSGATHWLANPAIIVENGGLGAVGSATGAFLNHSEFIYSDSGLSVTAIDRVRNYVRTNDTRALQQVWVHDRPQSSGTKPVDAVYAPAGIFRRGYDTAGASFTDGAAVVLKRGEYVFFDGQATPDALGGKFYSQNTGSTAIGLAADGSLEIIVGAGRKLRVAGLSAFANDTAAAAGGLGIGNIYVNSGTGALTYRLT